MSQNAAHCWVAFSLAIYCRWFKPTAIDGLIFKPFHLNVRYITMKQLILTFFVTLITLHSFCQTSTLDTYNAGKNKIDKTGFTVLAGWGAANIIYGSIAASGANGSNKYFNQMNAIWGATNLGLAAFSYFGIKREVGSSFAITLKEQIKLQKIFLFNAGLDLAYIATGLFLNERSKNVVKDSDKFKGYGESVLMQGGGLLIFDVVMYTLHNRHGKQLYKLAEKIQLTVAPGRVGMLVKL